MCLSDKSNTGLSLGLLKVYRYIDILEDDINIFIFIRRYINDIY